MTNLLPDDKLTKEEIVQFRKRKEFWDKFWGIVVMVAIVVLVLYFGGIGSNSGP